MFLLVVRLNVVQYCNIVSISSNKLIYNMIVIISLTIVLGNLMIPVVLMCPSEHWKTILIPLIAHFCHITFNVGHSIFKLARLTMMTTKISLILIMLLLLCTMYYNVVSLFEILLCQL